MVSDKLFCRSFIETWWQMCDELKCGSKSRVKIRSQKKKCTGLKHFLKSHVFVKISKRLLQVP